MKLSLLIPALAINSRSTFAATAGQHQLSPSSAPRPIPTSSTTAFRAPRLWPGRGTAHDLLWRRSDRTRLGIQWQSWVAASPTVPEWARMSTLPSLFSGRADSCEHRRLPASISKRTIRLQPPELVLFPPTAGTRPWPHTFVDDQPDRSPFAGDSDFDTRGCRRQRGHRRFRSRARRTQSLRVPQAMAIVPPDAFLAVQRSAQPSFSGV